jgi:hypothetical protein
MGYNRLVIIGNGFDLACGLESSYKHFILDTLKNGYLELIDNKFYDSPLFTLKYRTGVTLRNENSKEEISQIENIQELLNLRNDLIEIKFKGLFLDELFNSDRNNWIDIESFYFNKLISCWKGQQNNLYNGHFSDKHIMDLNNQLTALSECLRSYLLKIENIHPDKSGLKHSSFTDQLYERLPEKNYNYLNREPPKSDPSNVMILNFNYTGLASEALSIKEYNLLQIHGNIHDRTKEIVFGFGDDTNKMYKEIESYDYSEFLKKIKSFQYGRDSNYHHFLNFMEEKDFEVFVVGHSCGLSDKTLLKTIFEHEKCYAIKAFHYNGEEDHFYKRMAISRHFDDKISMRKKVLPYDEHYEMIQF